MTEQAAGRRTFVPIVGVGVGSAVIAAVAGNQAWASGRPCGSGLLANLPVAVGAGEVPAAAALALVVLAAWGVVLVGRGLVRRLASVVALVSSLGLVVSVVLGFNGAQDSVEDAYLHIPVECLSISLTAWFWVAAAAALTSTAATAVAVRWAGTWPEMGRRYDSPSDSPPEDLWKALDHGHDPTS